MSAQGELSEKTTAPISDPVTLEYYLRLQLRKLRMDAGMVQSEAAKMAGWCTSKVSRLETGERGINNLDDALTLLKIYGVSDDAAAKLVAPLKSARDEENWISKVLRS